jgi:hypothetical protein
MDAFLDGPGTKLGDAVHVLFAGESVRDGDPFINPAVTDSEPAGEFRVLSLAALVRVKLSVYRDKDRTHLRDMIEVGLIDASWVDRLPADLAGRLQHLIDTPGG